MKYDQSSDTYANSDISESFLLANSANQVWRKYLREIYNVSFTATTYFEEVTSRKYLATEISTLPKDEGGNVLSRILLDRLTMPIAFTAHQLGLFPFLHVSPGVSFTAVAERFSMDPRHSREILDGLCETGILARTNDTYSLTSEGEELALAERSGSPNPFFWGGTIEVIGSGMITPESLVQRILQRAASVEAARTGPGGDNPMMAQVETSEADARRFARHMRAQMQRAGERIADLPIWRGDERVLDVAGGSGHYLAALAARHPALAGSVLETPRTDAAAREALGAAGLGGRLGVVTGSMWEPSAWVALRGRYDVVFYSYVLHDWRPRDVVRLLAAAADTAASVPDGRVLVHDMFLRDGGRSPADKAGFGRLVWYWTDEGAQYRLSDVAAMAAAAGLHLEGVHPADGALSDLLVFRPARGADAAARGGAMPQGAPLEDGVRLVATDGEEFAETLPVP